MSNLINKKSFIFFLTLLTILLLNSAVVADKLNLQNGETYRGELLNDSLKIRTSYAEINIQSSYLTKISRENNQLYVLKAVENNIFSGNLLTELRFAANGSEMNISNDLDFVDLSSPEKFNDNKAISVTINNGDYFYANLMVESISIQTSLGSPLNINFSNISSIKYLKNEELYLIERKNGEDIKANFAQNKLIIWPAAGEIFELDLNYLEKLEQSSRIQI